MASNRGSLTASDFTGSQEHFLQVMQSKFIVIDYTINKETTKGILSRIIRQSRPLNPYEPALLNRSDETGNKL